MNSLNFSKPAALPALVILLFLLSCKKETATDSEQTAAGQTFSSLQKKNAPGFVENDMVMFWNEKAATVFNSGFTQPARTRAFARIQVAVHDALNSIKPKYERFAFHEREQHANPDAAVASAAYWGDRAQEV